jgi:hypothetical protein
MGKLSTWLQKRLRSGRKSKKRSPDQLPILPPSRRPITPASIDTSTCLFFRLPYDIRSIILLMLFGERYLHVDIVRHEENWHWSSKVCDRNRVWRSRQPPMVGNAWNDTCLDTHSHTPTTLRRCNIGIMRFLLACRQAYTEGIHVLYSSNLISIRSEPLLLHLPQLIPANRLASITSLEIVIKAHGVVQDGKWSCDLDNLQPILKNIVTYFNHLRRFCLAFQVNSRCSRILGGPALPLLDNLYRSTQLREMKVELPWSEYQATRGPVLDHPRETPTKDWTGRSRWRCLDSEEPSIQYRYCERFPFPPLKVPMSDDSDEGVESAGYWLSEGDTGPHRGWVSCGI